MRLADTIVAPITGPGPAAVAVVRLSGSRAWEIAGEVFRPWSPAPRLASYGRYTTGDDGLALPFAEGHSYTGEESVELSIHGSLASVRALLEACIAAGARLAEPGEFTQRAFLNGRIDLTRAEAVRDSIEAQTEAQLRHANLVREGALHREIGSLREEVLSLLASVEASVDFPEEVGPLDAPSALAQCASWLSRIEALLATASSGRIIRQGLRIALVGAPNAGKSSLLNALVGVDRAIVTPIPGTTRDTIEETVELGGVPCVLVDTAGLRDTADEVESIGVARTRREMERADLEWRVVDATSGEPSGWDTTDTFTPDSKKGVWTILNKIDLLPLEARDRLSARLKVSTVTREGLAELSAAVGEYADLQPHRVTIAPRHEPSLGAAHEAIEGVQATLKADLPEDLLAAGLQEAAQALGEITGETATPDMVERIFRDFCVGK